jgi:hypothetical protein
MYPDIEIIDWPVDLLPSVCTHHLRPHKAGSQSPLTRTRKTYYLSAPIWTMKLRFNSPYRGGPGMLSRGARLETMVHELDRGNDGKLKLARLWDFRRPYPAGLRHYYARFAGETVTFGGGETFDAGERFILGSEVEPVSLPAPAGAVTVTFFDFEPNQLAFMAGDFLGGDDRIHRVMKDAISGPDGRCVVEFDPPLVRALSEGGVVTLRPRGLYQLMNDDGAAGEAQGRAAQASYGLDFEEWLP